MLTQYRELDKKYKLIALILTISLLVDNLNLFFPNLLSELLYIEWHIFTLVEFTIYAWLLRNLVFSLRIRRIIPYVILGFWLFKVADLLWITPLSEVDSLAISLEAIILIALSAAFYLDLLRSLRIEKIETYPWFWIVAGILIYFCANLTLFIFSNYITSVNLRQFWAYWSIHAVFTIIKYLLFTVGIWLFLKEQRRISFS